MHPILRKLAGGDRRSIGCSNHVAAEVLARPALFRHLMLGLDSDDPLLRMRAADAIEKISVHRPDLLRPHKRKLSTVAGSSTQQELRWHCAQILPRLELTARERAVAVEILFDYLCDKSSIVKAFAMQALADFACQNEDDASLRAQLLPLLEELPAIGTPAMRARGRKLLRRFHHPRKKA